MNDLDDLLAEAEEWASSYVSWGDNGLVDRLIDALESVRAERDAYVAALQRVRELHRNSGASQGYTDKGYGNIENCCGTCGTFGEYGEPWPCPTIKALEGDE